ncbi:MAG: hypothetical protein O7C59_09620 [Rickettsia endosymbiont of Ixodes persulcatus]|nr:hypothetical protein [Rickettsia endosymbiont of Ixodes persulcatus]
MQKEKYTFISEREEREFIQHLQHVAQRFIQITDKYQQWPKTSMLDAVSLIDNIP